MRKEHHDLEEYARIRKWLEKCEEEESNHLVTYYNILNFARMGLGKIAQELSVTPEYVAETKILLEDMESHLTTLKLTYNEDWIYDEVRDVLMGWIHLEVLSQDENTRSFILKGEKDVLERVRVYIDGLIQEWYQYRRKEGDDDLPLS